MIFHHLTNCILVIASDCWMVHELDDLLSINQTLICNCRIGEIAAPIPYEGDFQFHIRLIHLQDLYMKKTISELPIK